MNYLKGIVRAVIPRRPHEFITVALMAIAMTYAGLRVFLQEPPSVVVFAETQYPRSVPQGGYFYLAFDLAFSKDCTIRAKRFILASDGVEYLAQEDSKDVVGGDRIQYTVRVPVSDTIPLGNALVRSQFIFSCDFWSRWVRPIERGGQARRVLVTPVGTMPTGGGNDPRLPSGQSIITIRYILEKPS